MTGWTWAAASRRGTSHEKTGTKRQDALRVLLGNDGRSLIAVACDGAGSASKGGEGAAIAARAFSQFAKAAIGETGVFPSDEDIWEWVDLTRDRIAAVAARRGLRPRDFATTVVMVISDGLSTLALHIGDGAAVGRRENSQEWQTLSWPEHGEYASTTYFLTDEGVPQVRISRYEEPIDRLAVFTDGIERLALDFTINQPHGPFFSGISKPVAASQLQGCDVGLSAMLGSYLMSDAINARTDDDKTLIIASRT